MTTQETLSGTEPAAVAKKGLDTFVFVDPADNQPIPTMQDAENQAATERAKREAAEIHAETEQIRANAAEAQARELEEQLRQMRNLGGGML